MTLVSVLVVWLIFGFDMPSNKVLFFGILSGVTYGIAYLVYYYLLSFAEVSRVMGVLYIYVVFVAQPALSC